MSQKSEASSTHPLGRIERLLNKHLETLGDPVTPHDLMDCLKSQSQEAGLTQLGSLLLETLSNVSLIESVRWVVFHFDFPPTSFVSGERATRNWISLRYDEQVLLNAVHEKTIKQSSESIRNIYAPSVLSQRVADILPDNAAEHILRKWWLYWTDEYPLNCLIPKHNNCYNALASVVSPGILCFVPTNQDFVSVFSCRNDHNDNTSNASTLGQLLGGEDERHSYSCYKEFVDLIKHRHTSEFPDLPSACCSLQCNFYARIPVFFCVQPKTYMTEIFVALYREDGDVSLVIQTLHDMEPVLRVCVSLINSQIAYFMGDRICGHELREYEHQIKEREHEMRKLLLRTIRHGLGNWTGRAKAAVDLAKASLMRNEPAEKTTAILDRAAQNCSVGILAAIGLQQYGLDEKQVTVADITRTVKTSAEFEDAVQIVVDSSVTKLRVKGRILLVLSELIDNAIRAQRNSGFYEHPLLLNVKAKDGRLVLELNNQCKQPPSWLKEDKEAIFENFPKDHGLWYCDRILSEVDGTLVLSLSEHIVTVKVEIEIDKGDQHA